MMSKIQMSGIEYHPYLSYQVAKSPWKGWRVVELGG